MPSSAVPSARTNATGTRSTSRLKCRSTSRLQTASAGKGDQNQEGGGGTSYDGLYVEVPPKRGAFLYASGKWNGTDFTRFIESRKGSIFMIDSYLIDSAFTAVKRNAKF